MPVSDDDAGASEGERHNFDHLAVRVGALVVALDYHVSLLYRNFFEKRDQRRAELLRDDAVERDVMTLHHPGAIVVGPDDLHALAVSGHLTGDIRRDHRIAVVQRQPAGAPGRLH